VTNIYEEKFEFKKNGNEEP